MDSVTKTKLNNSLESFASEVATKQAVYKEKHGRYFQGLRTTGNMPKDTNEEVLELSKKPHYQNENWLDFGIQPGKKLPFAVQIHQYERPNGDQGYDIICELNIGQKLYQKTISIGSEPNREKDWSEVIRTI